MQIADICKIHINCDKIKTPFVEGICEIISNIVPDREYKILTEVETNNKIKVFAY